MHNSELKLHADALLMTLASRATFGLIKKLSSTVGHDQLQTTYRKVKENLSELPSVELIDMSIKLDHFRGVPHYEIKKLQEKLKANKFASSLLKDLVEHLLYLYSVDFADKQKLADRFDIQSKPSSMLLNDNKVKKNVLQEVGKEPRNKFKKLSEF